MTKYDKNYIFLILIFFLFITLFIRTKLGVDTQE